MHTYSINSEERRKITCILAVTSILLAYGLYYLLLIFNTTVPWYIDAPSVMGFFGILYRTFDKYIWKRRIFKIFQLVNIPDMNGNWEGVLKTSYDGFEDQRPIKFEITQSWTNISIRLSNGISNSYSTMASFSISEPNGILLRYEYVSEPKIDAAKPVHIHRGFTRLVLSNDEKSLKGDYFTGKDNLNYGIICLDRKE